MKNDVEEKLKNIFESIELIDNIRVINNCYKVL